MSSILLIDDDNDMLAMTERWLRKEGYEVVSATSGREALEILSAKKPDLILLDYAMPDMNGPAMLSAIRADDSLSAVPVLYRTGMEDGSLDEDKEPRPDGVIPKAEGKPFLVKAVAEALAAR